MHNTIEFFRFSDKYEDVFIEDGHYLYACAECFGWAYMFAVNEYHKNETGEYIRHDSAGADVEYLQKLTPAPPDVAAEIIKLETRNRAGFFFDSEYNRDINETKEDAIENYCEYAFSEIDETAEKLKQAA